MYAPLAAVAAAFALTTVAFTQEAAADPAQGYEDSYQLNYLVNLQLAGTVVNIINTGFHGFSPKGNICVNIFVFDPATQLKRCCSCGLDPNGLMSVTGTDLIGGVTPVPSSITIKLLATLPPRGQICAIPTIAPNGLGSPGGYATGIRAWATRLRVTGSGTTFGTETAFSKVPLSVEDLSRLTNFCASLPTCRCLSGAL